MLNYVLELWPWPLTDLGQNIRTAHGLILVNCELFENPTRDSKDIERTKKRDGQTELKTICLPI